MDLKKLRDNSDAQADYMVDEITAIIKTCGKRLPGSDGEKAAIDYMANTLKEYSDDVKIEPFEVHPKAFFNWIQDRKITRNNTSHKIQYRITSYA